MSSTVPARYAVIGHPIAHSLSPLIHTLFAKQCGEHLVYERLLAPLDGFAQAVARFREQGGLGLNVTVPFKLEAAALAGRCSGRVRAAGAANTLGFDTDGIWADNTDGLGLVADLQGRLGVALADASVAILGAGGAARGVVSPLLDAGVARLVIVARRGAQAEALLAGFDDARMSMARFEDLSADTADIAVNATSAGLAGVELPVPAQFWPRLRLAYDMVYAARPTAFMQAARAGGCARTADGLGMLVEQAAESFLRWRGVRPLTDPVLAAVRRHIDAADSRGTR